MNERPAVNRLREAMRNANIEALDEVEEVAEEIGRHAVAAALAPPPQLKRLEPTDEERQRLLDAALADAIETVSRHRIRIGRRVCSRSDATITRQVYELLRSMAGADGGADNDASFQ
jgi:hypothetical protein